MSPGGAIFVSSPPKTGKFFLDALENQKGEGRWMVCLLGSHRVRVWSDSTPSPMGCT